VFDKVSFDYAISDGIDDGYLVPVAQRSVLVEGLDYSAVRTSKGDLNITDLAEVLKYEKNLHGVAHPTFEISNGRKTIVFAASVAHAERLCEIFNRHQPGCARFICGETDEVTRKQTLRDFKAGRFHILTNVGVLTEGFDEPGIEVVAIARPTKSRALYAQMIGRGTRPLPGVVDTLHSADDRRRAIRDSRKPQVEVLDFVGNAGRHKLITTADILGGNYDEDVRTRARRKARDAKGEAVDMRRMLHEAQAELERQKQEERRRADAATRSSLTPKAKYNLASIDPFDLLDVRPPRELAWEKGRTPSEKQIDFLRRNGVENAAGFTLAEASQLIKTIFKRRNEGRCSMRQAKLLKRYGYSADCTVAEASEIIAALEANNWKPLEAVAASATEGEV
jgi:superfamily II DNA or RNA helicase